MLGFIIIACIVVFVIGGIQGVKQAKEIAYGMQCANCNRMFKSGETYYNRGLGLNLCQACNRVVH